MNREKLTAQKREVLGKKVKLLRKEGVIPATKYGKGIPSESLSVNEKEFLKVYAKSGETGLVDLKVGESVTPVLLTSVAVHPVTQKVIHIDFRQVNLKEKISATVPVELIGESPAEKSGIGTLVLIVSEIEVEALPSDLPERFEIDATILSEVDQTFCVDDLKFDRDKVEIKMDKSTMLAKVEPPQAEEVIQAPAEVSSEEVSKVEVKESSDPKEETSAGNNS